MMTSIYLDFKDRPSPKFYFQMPRYLISNLIKIKIYLFYFTSLLISLIFINNDFNVFQLFIINEANLSFFKKQFI